MSGLKPRRLPSAPQHRILRPSSLHSQKLPDTQLNSTHIIGNFSRKNTISRPREAIRPKQLPKLQSAPPIENLPISPYFGKENRSPGRVDLEEICLPYELDEGLRPKALRKIDPNIHKVPLKQPGKPPADLKRGSFSRKYTYGSQATNVSILSEQNTSLDQSFVDIPSTNTSFIDTLRPGSRSPSPITTARHSRIQQLSRRFQLTKSSLSRHFRSEEPGGRPASRQDTLLIPSFCFLRALEEVTQLPN